MIVCLATGAACTTQSERVVERTGSARAALLPADALFEARALDDEQRELLKQLAEQSEVPLEGSVWVHGGTVRELALSITPPLGPDAAPEENALAFVEKYAPLWHLKDVSALKVVATPGDGCQAVTLQLFVKERPLFNSNLTVVFDEKGRLTGFAGRLNGDGVEISGDPSLSAKEARARVIEQLDPDFAEAVPEPTEIFFDDFYVSDGEHSARPAYLFHGQGVVGTYAVDATNGAIVIAGGPSVASVATGTCDPGDGEYRGLPVVVDPYTDTPAWVGVGIAGAPVDGKDVVERTYNLLGQDAMLRLFGDFAPRRHLVNPKVVPGVDGRTIVTFEESFAGLPVDGAYLQAHYDRYGNAEQVFARYVYRPNVRRQPNVSEGTARVTSDNAYVAFECGGDPACEQDLQKELSVNPAPSRLVVLSSRIYPWAQLPPKSEVVAWRFEYPNHVLYADAWSSNEQPGPIRLDLPKTYESIPSDIMNVAQKDRLEFRDGVIVSGVSPSGDSVAVNNMIPMMDGFLLGLGQNSYDGGGRRVQVHVNDNMQNATADNFQVLRFGVGWLGGDVFGHEFAHLVTAWNGNGGLDYAEEPGALNESFSDVLGNLAFPDGNAAAWLVGETTAVGPIRDMVTPGNFGQPGHVGLMTDSCMLGDYCVHTWSGVPNRAATIISDGGIIGVAHPGVGRPTLAQLALDTNRLEMPTDRFMNHRLRTEAACRARTGQTFSGRPLVQADCAFIGKAFDEVGITEAITTGWQKFSTGLFGNDWDYDIYAGLKLVNGCTIADHLLKGYDQSGAQQVSDSSTGWMIDFNGEWGASITFRGADTDPTDREVRYHVTSTWFEAGVADVQELLDNPTGADCYHLTPPTTTTHFRRLFSVQRISHWASFLNGGKGDDLVNGNVLMPPGCEVIATLGIHDHKNMWDAAPSSALDHAGNHGFVVSTANASPQQLAANIHWWHTGTSAISVRAVYDISEPDGFDCSVPGYTQDLP